MWLDTFVCVTWLFHKCDLTHSYVGLESLIRVIWDIRTCDLTRFYVSLDLFIHVTRFIHMCNMTHGYVWQNAFICVTWSFIRVTCRMHQCDVTLLGCNLTVAVSYNEYSLFSHTLPFPPSFSVSIAVSYTHTHTHTPWLQGNGVEKVALVGGAVDAILNVDTFQVEDSPQTPRGTHHWIQKCQ